MMIVDPLNVVLAIITAAVMGYVVGCIRTTIVFTPRPQPRDARGRFTKAS